MLREVSFGSDGEVSPEGFETRYNTELANEYGNLASRTLAMIDRYRDGVVPDAEAPAELAAEFDGLARGRARRASTRWSYRRARRDLAPVRRLNRYVQDEEPWQLVEGRGRRPSRLDEVLYALAEGLRVVSVLLHAVHARLGRAAAGRARPRGAVARRRAASARCRRRRQVGELGQLFPRVEPPSRGRLRRAAPWSTPTATWTPAIRPWRELVGARGRRASPGSPRSG